MLPSVSPVPLSFAFPQTSFLVGTSFRSLPTTHATPHLPSCKKRVCMMSAAAAAAAADPADGATLFIKAGPDNSIGDCPFSHKANLALRFQKVDFRVHLVDLANKPQWFLDMTEAGSVPVFLHDSHAIGDSEEILDYADKVGAGQVKLIREADPNWDTAFDIVSPIFGSMVRFLKNKDDNEDAKFKAALSEALIGLNSYLCTVEGPYLLGDNVSALDCNLAPKLKHASVAPKHYKGFEFPAECTAVFEYLTNFEKLKEWKASCYSDETIIWGWSKFFN